MTYDMFIAWGATARKINKGAFIFFEGDQPFSYYFLVCGQIKMYNTNNEGREFTEGIFEAGESFGESSLLVDEPYPTSAIATKDSVVLRLSRDRFLKMLSDNPCLERSLLLQLAQRLYQKTVISRQVMNTKPEQRLLSFLKNYCKKNAGVNGRRMPIPYTRQQLADMLGLRVETVIRTLKVMHQKKQVEIVNRKLYV